MPRLDVQIPTPDGDSHGTLHRPDGTGPWPGVLVFPDAGGVRETFGQLGDRLAGLGYVVLIPDIYYRAGDWAPFDVATLFTDPQERARLGRLTSVLTNDRIIADAGAYAGFLLARPEVTGSAIGTTGYCLGGYMSLVAAGGLGDRIAAAASFHGGRLAVAGDPASPYLAADRITATVYVAGATDDDSFTAEAAGLLERALTDAGVEHTVEFYPARHGFAVPDNPTYDAEADARHWTALRDLYRAQLPDAEPGSLAEYFDGWYANMTGSSVVDEIQQRHLGLPPRLLSTSLLTWDGIAEVSAELRVPAGGTLVDLACGRGGYGLEIAARTGARLVGVDFSAEAVRQARAQAGRLGATAEFRVGDLAGTGLGTGSADAVLCVDAIQFAPQPDAAYRELARVLAAGGRAVLTCWEPVDRDDQRVPERLRRVSLGAGLTAAGFTDVQVRERPGWRASEHAMWVEAAALDPGEDPALRSFHDEGVRVLETFDRLRRVIATATVP